MSAILSRIASLLFVLIAAFVVVAVSASAVHLLGAVETGKRIHSEEVAARTRQIDPATQLPRVIIQKPVADARPAA